MYSVCKLTLCVYYPARESHEAKADTLRNDHILCAGSADRPKYPTPAHQTPKNHKAPTPPKEIPSPCISATPPGGPRHLGFTGEPAVPGTFVGVNAAIRPIRATGAK